MNGNSPFLQQIFVPDTHHRFAVDRLGEAHLSSKDGTLFIVLLHQRFHLG